ncbi:MAG: SRPBCC domain-containing protein [Ferruginibacter sp.]
MKNLIYKIAISAGAQKVWEIMLAPDTYQEWVNAAWPGSFYEGRWAEGENLRFIGKDGSGTLALLESYKPYTYISARHIAILQSGGIEDRESDIAKGWIGTTENYMFKDESGVTMLTVELIINPEWEKMFNEGWPKALARLKEICETGS